MQVALDVDHLLRQEVGLPLLVEGRTHSWAVAHQLTRGCSGLAKLVHLLHVQQHVDWEAEHVRQLDVSLNQRLETRGLRKLGFSLPLLDS